MRSYVVTNTLIGLVGTASAVDYASIDIDTFCITYLSTYLAPVSVQPGSSLSTRNSSVPTTFGTEDQTSSFPEPARTSAVGPESLTLDSTLTEAQSNSGSPLLSSTTVSLTNTIITSLISITTLNPTAFPTSSSIIEPAGRPVIFQVQRSDNQKRQVGEGASGGFVGSDNPEVCTFAAVFNLAEGQLFNGGVPLYYSGEDFKQLDSNDGGALNSGSVTRTFESNGRRLVFRNSALPNGQAGFCQDPSGQVYLTFTAGPPGCVEVTLSVYDVAQCQNGRLVGVDTSTTVGTVSATGTGNRVSSGSIFSEDSTAVGTTEAFTAASFDSTVSSSSPSNTETASPTGSEAMSLATSVSSEGTETVPSTSTSSNSQPSSEPTGLASSSSFSVTEETTTDTSASTSELLSPIDASTTETTTTLAFQTTAATMDETTTSTIDDTTSDTVDETTTATVDKTTTDTTTDTTTTTSKDTTTAIIDSTTTATVDDTTTTTVDDTTAATIDETTTADQITTTDQTTTAEETTTTDETTTAPIDETTTTAIVDTTTAPETTTAAIADTTTDLTMTTSSAPEAGSCPATANPYTTGGSTFDTSCGMAITGGTSMGDVAAENFQECTAFCDQFPTCVAIQYDTATQDCNLFSSYSGTTIDNGSDVAIKQVTPATTTTDLGP